MQEILTHRVDEMLRKRATLVLTLDGNIRTGYERMEERSTV